MPSSLPIALGRQAILVARDLLDRRESFVMETTLSGSYSFRLMERAKLAGYELNLVFIGTADVAINIARVAKRVSEGGHDVPEQDIRRRYVRSLDNLKAASSLADVVFIYDNTVVSDLVAVKTKGGELEVLKKERDWFTQYF